MSCRNVRARLGALLDATLAPGERARVEAHLAGCAPCRAEREAWEAHARALRAAGPTALPAGLADRAWRAAVRGERAPREGELFLLTGRRALLAGAAAAAAIWIAALAAGGPPRSAPPAAMQDALEVAVLVWAAGEVGPDAE